MGEDVVQAGDFILLLLLGLIKKHEVFLAAVEVEAADGFAIVVIQKDGEVGLAVPVMNAVYRHRFAQDTDLSQKAPLLDQEGWPQAGEVENSGQLKEWGYWLADKPNLSLFCKAVL